MDPIFCPVTIRKDGRPVVTVPSAILAVTEGQVLTLTYGEFWGTPMWELTLTDTGSGIPVACHRDEEANTVLCIFPPDLDALDFQEGETVQAWAGVPYTALVLLKHRPFPEASDV